MRRWKRLASLGTCVTLAGAGLTIGMSTSGVAGAHPGADVDHSRGHKHKHQGEAGVGHKRGAGHASIASLAEPVSVDEVPSTLPASGVDINGQAVLAPLPARAPTTSGYITEDEVLTDAHSYANNPDLKVGVPLLADLTLPESIPGPGSTEPADVIENTPAWIITYTAPQPFNVAHGRPGSSSLMMQHVSIGIDANTGRFLVGFFTR